MVKSNKFDYTGRTSSGPKLGKIVSADLEKRADKKRSTGTRNPFRLHASKARAAEKERDEDQEKDNDSHGGAPDLHKLDIKLPGKKLTDDGFALFANGLQKALSACGELVLVDLNVSDNALTTRSLARLAPIIYQSRFSLQTLDLSSNSIEVTNKNEARDWEAFLSSFSGCMALRRIDLSQNTGLGAWAFEVLVRVYNREKPVDPLPACGNTSVISLVNDKFANDDDNDRYHSKYARHSRQMNRDIDELPRCANGKTLADTWVLGYRCGLRSLPYLTLRNVGLSDSGALFLSYIIEKHYYPIQLISEINASGATNQTRTYQQDANDKGIDWDDNTSLSRDATHLLKCAGMAREKMLHRDLDSMANSGYGTARASEMYAGSHRRISTSNRRRSSARSMYSTVDDGMHDKYDVDSARKKIQRNIIVREHGGNSVELWRAALSAIACSRKLFLIAPRTGNFASKFSTADEDLSVSIDSLASYDNIRRSEESLLQRGSLASIDEHQSRMSYAATLMTTSPQDDEETIFAITDVTNTRTVPYVQTNFKAMSLRGNDVGPRSETPYATPTNNQRGSFDVLNGPIERDDTSDRYLEYQTKILDELRDSHDGASDGYRDTSLQCHLPLPICLHILAHAMDTDISSILNENQQQTSFAWGQKREALMEELEWRKKDESSQILMLLGAAECVEY